MGKLRNTVLVLFVLLLITLAVIIYVVPSVTGMLVETYPAEYGELSIYDDTTGYFLRNDTVYAAESGGEVNKLSQEGDLLRPLTTVCEVTGSNDSDDSSNVTDGSGELVGTDRATEIKNKIASRMKKTSDNKIESGGILSFFVDGYEYSMIPERASSLKKAELEETSQNDVTEVGNTVRSGYPLFKIIGNNGWKLIAYIPKDHLDQYEEGEKVDVTFFEKDDSNEKEFVDLSSKDPLFNKVEMLVDTKGSEGDYGKLVLRSTRFFGGIGKYRVAYCRIVSQDVSGLIIENESIVTENGVTGVYVKNKKGKYDFVPILIYGSDDTHTVIANQYFYDSKGEYTRTLDPFDDVLRTPRTQEEGE